MSTFTPSNAVYTGASLYTNNVFKNGDFAWMIDLKTKQIVEGCLFQPTGRPRTTYAIYFIPNTPGAISQYQPDFKNAIRADSLLFAESYGAAMTYLSNLERHTNQVQNIKNKLHNSTIGWVVDKTKDAPVPCILTKLNINGTVKSIATPIINRSPNGELTVNTDKMFFAEGYQFSQNYTEAKHLLDATKQPEKPQEAQWETDPDALNKLAQAVMAETNTNIIDMPATEVIKTIQKYMNSVYDTDKEHIKINIVLTNVGEWYCVMNGPSANAIANIIRAVHQDNSMTMHPDILARHVMCRRLCEKLIKRATGLNIQTSAAIPKTTQINFICE